MSKPKPTPITEERVRDIVQRLVHPAAVIGHNSGAKQPMDPRADNPPTTTARQNTFLLAAEATEAARQLAHRVCILADRIAGSVPENGCATAGEKAGPSSLIAALDEDARITLHQLNAANDALSRIERELP